MCRRLRNDALMIAGAAHAVELAPVAPDHRHACGFRQRNHAAHTSVRALGHKQFVHGAPGFEQFGHGIAALDERSLVAVLRRGAAARLFVSIVHMFHSVFLRYQYRMYYITTTIPHTMRRGKKIAFRREISERKAAPGARLVHWARRDAFGNQSLKNLA